MDSICKLNSIKVLNLKNNENIKIIPKEIIEKDSSFEYYQSLKKEKPQEWKRVKLIVMGHGQIGKTTLLGSLHLITSLSLSLSLSSSDKLNKSNELKKSLKESVSSTRTLEVQRWNISSSSSSIQFRIFDFGGQTEYSVSHRHFLSQKQCVYWICFDTSKPPEEGFSQLSHWLHYYLESQQKQKIKLKLPCFIVGTKWDLCKSRNSLLVSLQSFLSSPQWKELQIQQIFMTSSYELQLFEVSLSVLVNEDNNNNNNNFRIQESSLNSLIQLSSESIKSHLLTLPKFYFEIVEKEIPSTPMKHPLDCIVSLKEWKSYLMKKYNETEQSVQTCLQYLHDIGEVFISPHDKEWICIDIQEIARWMTVFAAPEDVRLEYFPQPCNNWILQGFLKESEIFMALQRMNPPMVLHEIQYQKKILQILQDFEFCIEMKQKQQKQNQENRVFLFPGLRKEGIPEFQFPSKKQKWFICGFCFDFSKNLLKLKSSWISLQLKLYQKEAKIKQVFLSSMNIEMNETQIILFCDETSLSFIFLGKNPTNCLDSLIKIETSFLEYSTYETLCPFCLIESISKRNLIELCKIHEKQNHSFNQTKRKEKEGEDDRKVNIIKQIEEDLEKSKQLFEVNLIDPQIRFSISNFSSLWKENMFLSSSATELWTIELDPFQSSHSKEEYQELSQVMSWWNQMIQDKYEDFLIEKVTLFRNPILEEKFLQHYHEWMKNKNNENNNKNLNFSFNQKKTKEKFDEFCSKFQNPSSIPESHLIMGWWGNKKEILEKIAISNFKTPKEVNIDSIDPGYFGKGYYFTQFPIYSAEYLNLHGDVLKENSLLLSWMMLGSVRFITEEDDFFSHIFSEEWKNEQEDKSKHHIPYDYDSHYIVVERKYGMSFYPVSFEEEQQQEEKKEEKSKNDRFDEFVLFQRNQILPRYIINFHTVIPTILWLGTHSSVSSSDNNNSNNLYSKEIKFIKSKEFEIKYFENEMKLINWMNLKENKIYSHYPISKFKIISNENVFEEKEKKKEEEDSIKSKTKSKTYELIRKFHRAVPIFIYCKEESLQSPSLSSPSPSPSSSLHKPHEFLFVGKNFEQFQLFISNFDKFQVEQNQKR